jgi:hypothetical protein
LSEPGTLARETLVVYGFTERDDFERSKPRPGATAPQGAAYAAELTRALETLALSRWARAVTTYAIAPGEAATPP